MKIEYIKSGDYLVPNINIKNDLDLYKLNKYGRMRYKFIKEVMKIEYMNLLMENKLQKHLLDIQNKVRKELDKLICLLAEKENITEDLKEFDNFEWTKCMNNIKNRAEEVVINKIIYKKEVINNGKIINR